MCGCQIALQTFFFSVFYFSNEDRIKKSYGRLFLSLSIYNDFVQLRKDAFHFEYA